MTGAIAIVFSGGLVTMAARNSRPVRTGSRAMSNLYSIDLDRNAANYAPLTPLSLLAPDSSKR